MKSQATIETIHRRVQKIKTFVHCQDFIREKNFVKLFTEDKKARHKRIYYWFDGQGQ